MARITRKEQEEREEAAEDLVLSGWTREGARELAVRFGVADRTVRGWREPARARIRERGQPGATAAASLEDALERLEILWTRALREGNLRVARAVLWDRSRLLDLVPRNRIEVGGNVTIDVTSRKRVDVSIFPPQLLEAIARGVSDDELDELIAAEVDDELEALIGKTTPALAAPDGVIDVDEAHAERVGSDP